MQLYLIKNKLSKLDNRLEVVLEGERYIGNEFGSDRGDYSDMYIQELTDPESKNRIRTVGELKALIKKAYEQKIMIGYKGGTYRIKDGTLVKIGYYGVGGNPYIEEISVEENRIVIELS